MTFIFFFFFLKKFEKVEKTGIISTKFLVRCTPSVILGMYTSIYGVHTLKFELGLMVEAICAQMWFIW